jgi:succinate dehydrogenase/fumarate reductase flavoprotein subunit
MEADIETDVLVAGAGMAGLVSAVEVADQDAEVTVLEKGPEPGGTMAISAGLVWTYGTYEDARKEVPKGDPMLHRLIVENIEGGFKWLTDHGVELDGLPFTFPSGEEFGVSLYDDRQAKQMDPEEFIDQMLGIILDSGGEVHTETPFSDLLLENRKVVGAEAIDPGGNKIEIAADAVILATGGFQGNKELVQRYITKNTDNLWLRSNPWSTGDAFIAATDADAKIAGDLSKFSGPHLLSPPASFEPTEFLQVTQSHASFGLAIDRHGKRIHDESESSTENPLAQAVARKSGGEAYVIIDNDAAQREHLGGKPLGDRIEQAVSKYGGQSAVVDTMGALRNVLYEWGVNGDQAIHTIRKFNEAIKSGKGARLDPPRRGNQQRITEPPFIVLAVQPGITYTNGGLAVTKQMEVISRIETESDMGPYTDQSECPTTDTTEDEREDAIIDGLYAAGVDVGNISHDHYFGGLGPSLVMGRIAGQAAATQTR